MKKIKDSDWCSYLSIFIINYLLVSDHIKEVISIRPSGLYADNGHQTLVHATTKREIRQLQEQILDFFDLPEKPVSRTGRSVPIKNSAAEFLIDVYRNSLGKDSDDNSVDQQFQQYKTDGDFNLTRQDLNAIDQSDVIMSFAAQNHHASSVEHGWGHRLWFDVSQVNPGVNIINAELRLYQSLEFQHKKNEESFKITAYRVLKTNNRSNKLKYVDSAHVTINQEGWITLNVSEAFSHWVYYPDENKGLYLSAHSTDGSVHEMKPEEIGIVGFNGPAEKQPFMVGFFKSFGSPLTKNRHKRETRRTRQSESSYFNNEDVFVDRDAELRQAYSSSACQIRSFYVNFTTLQWDFIIAPDGYEAHHCAGDCNFPLNSHMNPTNHAIVQTLARQHIIDFEVPKACCVPTKLASTSLLYNDDGNIVLKKYKGMIAKSCGCH